VACSNRYFAEVPREGGQSRGPSTEHTSPTVNPIVAECAGAICRTLHTCHAPHHRFVVCVRAYLTQIIRTPAIHIPALIEHARVIGARTDVLGGHPIYGHRHRLVGVGGFPELAISVVAPAIQPAIQQGARMTSSCVDPHVDVARTWRRGEATFFRPPACDDRDEHSQDGSRPRVGRRCMSPRGKHAVFYGARGIVAIVAPGEGTAGVAELPAGD